jgi:hypothetical protein
MEDETLTNKTRKVYDDIEELSSGTMRSHACQSQTQVIY